MTAELAVPPLQEGEYLFVRALRPDGRNARLISFKLWAPDWSSLCGERLFQVLEDGTYLVPLPDVMCSGEGRTPRFKEYCLTAYSSRYGEQTARLQTDVSREVTFQFEQPSALLSAHIDDYVGSGFEGMLRLELHDDKGSHCKGRPDGLDWDGCRRFGPVDPGHYQLLLKYGNYRGHDEDECFRIIGVVPLSLESGFNETAVSIPRLHSLTVVCNSPGYKAVKIQHIPEHGKSWGEIMLCGDGAVTFTKLPAGPYRISGPVDYKRVEMTASVPEDQLVTLTKNP